MSSMGNGCSHGEAPSFPTQAESWPGQKCPMLLVSFLAVVAGNKEQNLYSLPIPGSHQH